MIFSLESTNNTKGNDPENEFKSSIVLLTVYEELEFMYFRYRSSTLWLLSSGCAVRGRVTVDGNSLQLPIVRILSGARPVITAMSTGQTQ